MRKHNRAEIPELKPPTEPHKRLTSDQLSKGLDDWNCHLESPVASPDQCARQRCPKHPFHNHTGSRRLRNPTTTTNLSPIQKLNFFIIQLAHDEHPLCLDRQPDVRHLPPVMNCLLVLSPVFTLPYWRNLVHSFWAPMPSVSYKQEFIGWVLVCAWTGDSAYSALFC